MPGEGDGDGDAPPDFHENLWTLCIKDCNNRPVELSWVSRKDDGEVSEVPSLPFQIYVLDTAPKTATYPKLAELFARWMDWGHVFDFVGGATCHCEIYRTAFSNVLACVDHQRQEIQHRNSKDTWSHIVANWADYDSCHKCPYDQGYILVIDRDDWTTEGVLQVTFTQPPNSQVDYKHMKTCGLHDPRPAVLAERKSNIDELFENLHSRRKWFGRGPGYFADYHGSADDGEEVDESRERPWGEFGRKMSAATFLSKFDLAQERLLANVQSPGLKVSNYFDGVGWPVSNVWDSLCTRRRPELSFSLYVAEDVTVISPQALYTSLHQEAPADSVWSLDIIWQVANISTAMQHYFIEGHRWPSRRAAARHRLRLFGGNVARRAIGNTLPEEILQYIEDLSIPAQQAKEDLDPSYAPLTHIFLYLDAATLGSGPQIAIVDPRVISSKVMTRQTIREERVRTPWIHSFSYDYGFIYQALKVIHHRSWARVSQRLHSLWSLRGARSTDFEEENLPYFVAKVDVPAVCVARAYNHDDRHPDWEDETYIDISLTLHGSVQPVTVHDPSLPESVLFESLVVTDTTTGQDLDLTRLSKARKLERPSISGDEEFDWCSNSSLTDFEPGQTSERVGGEDSGPWSSCEWWYNILARNELVDGRSYRVRVKEGLRVERWTFGKWPWLKGPFNLPSIRVEPGEDTTFVYKRA